MEIFIPKIPSMTITDLARAIDPDCTFKILGIRPGEKLHEVMCPADDSHLTLEFEDHYVIRPTIQFSHVIDFTVNKSNETGKPVPSGFQYSSDNNSLWLDEKSLKEFIG